MFFSRILYIDLIFVLYVFFSRSIYKKKQYRPHMGTFKLIRLKKIKNI